ncbi:hypothetical protein F5884DRAFT_860410 [Xylogone sp. PMI_703]|nr:hypothetical protein F5884DRAFT_860410 [Xylogone sp. PMI_703]
MAKSSEIAREREVYRYYQPPDLSHGSRPIIHDPALTAFAQLGVVRLNAQRGVVNLTAAGREWILTIVGKNRTLQDDGRGGEDPDGNNWPTIGEKELGLAPRTVELLDGKDSPDGQPLPHLIVNDLHTDPRFSTHPILVNESYVRFIAVFPLRTYNNIIIGTYMIVDDKPREHVCSSDIEWLSSMAVTIMEHLDNERVRRIQDRSERMIKAMGLFVEGKHSIRDWWVNGGIRIQGSAVKNALKDRTPDYYADNFFGVQEPANGYAVQGIQELHKMDVNGYTSSLAAAMNAKRPIPRGVSFHSSTSITDSTGELKTSSEAWESNTDITTEDLQQPTTPLPEPAIDHDAPFSTHPDAAQGKRLQEALLTSDLKRAFARASNLIREATVLDGCVFFDASIGSFGGSAQSSEKPPAAFKWGGSSGGPSSSDDENRAPNIDSALSDGNLNGSPPAEPASHINSLPPKEPEKGCNVLGFSTRTRSSINSHEPSEELLSFPENLLRRFLKKYPHGKIMSFDDEGTVFSSSDSDQLGACSVPLAGDKRSSIASHSSIKSKERRMSREAEYKAVRAAFPGARSVAFFPLWDSAKERWFAGAFTWSSTRERVLCHQEDLTYMASFGNTIMAEVARLSSLAVSQMKTDFISSISHELRSPLHGILGSVEFLQESALSPMQADLINTIHSCGKTLLDTINHVLDFSKVNKKVKHHKNKRRKRKGEKGSKDRLSRRGSIVPSEDVEDLCTISEEVVDSVYAGTSMSKRYPQVRGPHKHSPSNSLANAPETSPVQVIMDIAWRPNWNFEVDAGAWRRILMNIVNNALKYTDSGFVRLELGVQNDLTSRHGEPQSNVTITLTDSGKGISKEFLKHHLYTPFMQEDSLASGTGLGLSIVKQIIYDIGGTIDITSEQGTGTEVRVSLPLRPSRSSSVPEGLSTLADLREKTMGKRVCLVAFDLLPNLGETPTGILSPEDQAIIHLKSSMQGLFHDWFGMEVITAHSLETLPEASVYVVVESRLPIQGSLTERILCLSQKHQAQNTEPKAMLILDNASTYSESNFTTRNRLHVRFLQQPYGPHKIGAALQEVFCNKDPQPVLDFPVRGQTYDPDFAAHIDPTLHFASKRRVQISCAIKGMFCPVEVAPLETNGQPNHTSDPAQVASDTYGLSHEPSQQPTNESAAPTDKHQIRRALLVEDNEINLKLLVIYMKKLKIDHVTAVNGLEALNAYDDAKGEFDIILMDISMPVMDGLTSARKIRKLELDNDYPAAAIIALTGAASMSARQEAFSAGIDLFLTKPVPMKYLQVLLGSLRERGREALMEEGM